MALSLQQVQKQIQRLIMTPQMQQSIQLLQMNSMDLEMLIRDEMLENPFLELGDDEEGLETGDPTDGAAADAPEPVEVESGLSDEARERVTEFDEAPEYQRTASTEGTGELVDQAETSEGSEEFQRLAEADVDWGEQFDDSDTVPTASTREDVEENDFTTYTKASESLYDSLRRQLRLSTLSGRAYEIGEFIIGNINEDGYLDCTLENLCLMVGYPPELIAPDTAGSEESVDARLRSMLARLHKGEKAAAFEGMRRKELIARIAADLLQVTYDSIAPLKKNELYVHLIAHQLKRPAAALMQLHPSELVLETIAWRMKTRADRVFDVLEIIHEFEPTGVAARSLGECLRLQCEEQGIRNRILYQVLDDHLEDLQQKRFREIAKAMEVPEDKVVEVFNIVSRLNPKPGSTLSKDTPQYITPDVYVKKVEGKYMYFLNEGDAGRLKVASNYRRMIVNRSRKGAAQAAAAAQAASTATGTWTTHQAEMPSRGDIDYASEKYKSAVWLIRNIEKRKSTILRVTEAIMDYQKEFLEKGIEHLRPLTLRDIAERVGMHESTIARVTTKKYVETPRGLFELKFFFSSGLETDDGEAASSRAIKELLTQMIEAEDKRRPLSDQKIADMLRNKGFQIARRTVAKYREQLKILPAKLRKDVN